MYQSQSMFIVTSFCQGFMELSWLISWLLVDFQEANTKAWGCKHRNLKLKSDRRLDPSFVFHATAQKYFALEEALKFSLKLLYPPHDSSMFWFIFGSSHESVRGDWGCALGRWYFDDYIISIEVFIVDSFELHSDLHFVGSNLGIVRHNFERQIDILSDSIAHEFKGTVWRNEGNRPFFIKLGQFDTLMELHIINSDAFIRCSHSCFSGLLLHQQLVVHPYISSFVPSLHSGIPLNLEFSLITPVTSARRIVPLFENKQFTFSITSM